MEKKRKYNSLIKLLILCILQAYIFSFYAFLFFTSLSDAEPTKDGLQNHIRCYFAHNIDQVEDTFTQVLGDEVAG